MNKTELAKALAADMEVSLADAKSFLESFQDVVTRTVCTGDPVAITGFVKFARVDRPARMGRNPATGETIKIKAKRAVRVTALKSFKDEVMASGKKKGGGKKNKK